MLRNLLRWARITKGGSDAGQFATQQMTYRGKVADGMMVFPYGLHANVLTGSLGLMFSVGGDPDNRAVIAWTPKDRPVLSEGEVAFYHPPSDGQIIWRSDGSLEIVSGNGGSADINITAANVNITGNVHITGSNVTHNGKEIGENHQHSQGSDSDGDSEVDIVGVL